MRRPGQHHRLRTRPGLAGQAAAAGGAPALTLPTSLDLLVLDARVGVTDAGGGAVSAWADQSPAGNDASQGSSGARPTLTTHGTLGTVIAFDGSTDWMDLDGIASSGGDWTIIAVVDQVATSGAGGRQILDFQAGRVIAKTAHPSLGFCFHDTAYRGTTAPSATGVQALMWHQSGTTVSLYRGRTLLDDDVSAGNALGGANAGLGADYLGSGGHFGGDVAFVGVANAALDATGRTAVWDYLAQEWPGSGL